jgi:hypothetical protein
MTAKLTAAEITEARELCAKTTAVRCTHKPPHVDLHITSDCISSRGFVEWTDRARTILPRLLSALDDAGRALEEAREEKSECDTLHDQIQERLTQERAMWISNSEFNLAKREESELALASALERASKAEGELATAKGEVGLLMTERNWARRMYCAAEARYENQKHADESSVPLETARAVCLEEWPADADSLFPPAAEEASR